MAYLLARLSLSMSAHLVADEHSGPVAMLKPTATRSFIIEPACHPRTWRGQGVRWCCLHKHRGHYNPLAFLHSALPPPPSSQERSIRLGADMTVLRASNLGPPMQQHHDSELTELHCPSSCWSPNCRQLVISIARRKVCLRPTETVTISLRLTLSEPISITS